MNETTPLLVAINPAAQQNETSSLSKDSKDVEGGRGNGSVESTTATTTTSDSQSSTTTGSTLALVSTQSQTVAGEGTDGVLTKQQNMPILELLALTAIISGSLSMYWGISGMLVGSTAGAAISAVMTSIVSQPIILVHIIMSTCVVVLAPVVTVQKVQLSALGSLREQQNELRTQINSFNQMNDELTKSITSIVDEADKIEKINKELEIYATSANTTTDRLVQLYTEQNEINQQIQEQLQGKILEQIITITLQSDTNQNYIVSENEVSILIERLQSIPGVVMNVDTFRNVLKQSEPAGSLTITDICSIARNMQANDTIAQRTEVSDGSVVQFGDPVFIFHPKDVVLLQK